MYTILKPSKFYFNRHYRSLDCCNIIHAIGESARRKKKIIKRKIGNLPHHTYYTSKKSHLTMKCLQLLQSRILGSCGRSRAHSPLKNYNRLSSTTTNSQAVLQKDLKSLFSNPPLENSFVQTQGWIRSVRSMKKIAFVDLSDGTTFNSIMIVTSPEIAKDLQTGSSIMAKGSWVKSKGKNQLYELSVTKPEDLQVIGNVEENYPLQKKFHTAEFIRSLPTLKFHTSKLSTVMRSRSFMEYKLQEFFQSENFIKVNPH